MRRFPLFVTVVCLSSVAIAANPGVEFQVNDTPSGDRDGSWSPVVAGQLADDGNFAVLFRSRNTNVTLGVFDLWVQLYDKDYDRVTALNIKVNTTEDLPGSAHQNDVAMDASGNFVVTWGSNSNQTFFQRFNSTGVKVGAETPISATDSSGLAYTNVAMNASGNYVIVWQKDDAGGTGIYGQRYNSSGSTVGSEFPINTTTAGTQQYPRVGMASDGSFAVTWQGNGPGDTDGVFMQRYDSSGVKAGVETRVNTTTVDSQMLSYMADNTIAMNQDGEFVIVWGSNAVSPATHDHSYFQYYDSSGSPIGGETQADTDTVGGRTMWAASAIDDDGKITVTWMNNGGDGDGWGMFARQFELNAAGDAVVPLTPDDFQVNTTTADGQGYGHPGMTADGNAMIAWYWDDRSDAPKRYYNVFATGVAIPEPATLFMLSVGSLALLRRRRRD